MTGTEETPKSPRVRREPPRFRQVAVQRVEPLGPRMTRVTLAGPDLEGLVRRIVLQIREDLKTPGLRNRLQKLLRKLAIGRDQ